MGEEAVDRVSTAWVLTRVVDSDSIEVHIIEVAHARVLFIPRDHHEPDGASALREMDVPDRNPLPFRPPSGVGHRDHSGPIDAIHFDPERRTRPYIRHPHV